MLGHGGRLSNLEAFMWVVRVFPKTMLQIVNVHLKVNALFAILLYNPFKNHLRKYDAHSVTMYK